jgi:hypothetical protein
MSNQTRVLPSSSILHTLPYLLLGMLTAAPFRYFSFLSTNLKEPAKTRNTPRSRQGPCSEDTHAGRSGEPRMGAAESQEAVSAASPFAIFECTPTGALQSSFTLPWLAGLHRARVGLTHLCGMCSSAPRRAAARNSPARCARLCAPSVIAGFPSV